MILLIGTADEYLVQKAKEYSDNPILVTEDNWTEAIDVGYTGIEEFNNKLLLLKLLDRADEIIYFPKDVKDQFDLNQPTATSRGWLEYLLLLINQTNPVINLTANLLGTSEVLENSTKFLNLTDIRKSNGIQLWTAGCSYTCGAGVNLTESYPALLSDRLNIPLSNLSKKGTSISWAADQIIRSDIRKGDIVIWGLTNKERANWWIDNQHCNVIIQAYKIYKNLDKHFPKRLLLDSDNSLYQSLTHIHQVINFCHKIKAKLLIVGLLTVEEDLLYLGNLTEYYHYYNKNSAEMLDYGSDNEHPGPLQHQDYANKIIEQLQLRNWI
jgi:hypothetical protein